MSSTVASKRTAADVDPRRPSRNGADVESQSILRTLICAAAFSVLSTTVVAEECSNTAGRRFSVCRIDLATEALEVFWLDEKGSAFGTLPALDAWLSKKNRKLKFAMNGGMFEPEPTLPPTGMLIAASRQLKAPNTNGWGERKLTARQRTLNFYQMPNGVFWIEGGKAHIADTMSYIQAQRRPDLAVQSGPLLARSGAVTDIARTLGGDYRWRNGVCLAKSGELLFVISNRGETIAGFAAFLVNELHCRDALYLDGGRSVLHSAQLRRSDRRTDAEGNVIRVGAVIGLASN